MFNVYYLSVDSWRDEEFAYFGVIEEKVKLSLLLNSKHN